MDGTDRILVRVPNLLPGIIFMESEAVDFDGERRPVADSVVDHEIQGRGPVSDVSGLFGGESGEVRQQVA